MSAQYWIAQHLQDLFRKEPRNVGVIVRMRNTTVGRFFGEDAEQRVDGRKLRVLPYPDVYRQWVEYWRSEMQKPGENVSDRLTGQFYRVVDGGAVDEIGNDSAMDVANYLYALLVSEGGFREALATTNEEEETEEAQPLLRFDSSVEEIFHESNLLADEDKVLAPAHPIRRGEKVQGKTVIHVPAFVQRNGTLYVMETVDFTGPQKQRSRDHAGWSAYMFNDLRKADRTAECISIIKISDEDLQNEHVDNGLTVLKNESEIVNWAEPHQRERFLAERRKVAVG
jgi:hypothetical protein